MTVKILTSTENLPYEDWLEYRKKGIGGSDASVVCGISRYKSPVELWMEKTNQIPQQEAGEAAYWGTQLEALVRAEFTKRTGMAVKPVNQLLQSEEYPFMLANLDGVCEHPDLGTCIFEAKTASAYKAGEWEDSIPAEYMLQVQHYLQVTEYIIPRSEITLPDTAAQLLLQYDNACEQLEAITEQRQQAENLLKQMMGEHEVGTAGNRIITWKSISQERLDSKTFKAEHPTLYKKYANMA